MISNQILQSTIDGIREITKAEIAVFDGEGHPVAFTSPQISKISSEEILRFAAETTDSEKYKSFMLIKVLEEGRTEYIIAVAASENEVMIAKMAALQLQGLMVAYKERLDKESFVKNLLLDNLLLVDIYNRARKFHIPTNARRVVFLLEASPDKEKASFENIESLFENSENDFVTAVDVNDIIIVKELEPDDDYRTAEKIAASVMKAVGDDGRTRISYGTIVNELKDVSRSYKEATMALDVGKIFSPEKNIIAYSSLGIGRLIYQLPIPLCKMFIREIFTNRTPDKFDEETIVTINKFFKNNLNVSETSRQLYIHRNTLVYRLDKIHKSTGLDLRVFEDAITFKIALMVVRYMKYMETLDY
ncbi:MAG: helix-turn-helix domain-containing protein [Lachnospiraceae bacterium]|nr:helix-turn-helix domain-containing protein [Lachnospiraceae bacterium]